MGTKTIDRATTPEARLREMERALLDRSEVFGAATGALFRIAQGVERPQDAAVFALTLIGCDELAALARTQAAPVATDGEPQTEEG